MVLSYPVLFVGSLLFCLKSFATPIPILTSLPQDPIYYAGEDGGASGGGGFYLPAIPNDYDPDDMDKAIRALKLASSHFVNSLNRSTDLLGDIETHFPLLKKHLLIEIASKTPPVIYTKSACVNGQGLSVDGSLYSHYPNTICVSAKTLHQKVNDKEYFIQGLALLAHEYSEIAGFSEDEAVQLQKFVIQNAY